MAPFCPVRIKITDAICWIACGYVDTVTFEDYCPLVCDAVGKDLAKLDGVTSQSCL